MTDQQRELEWNVAFQTALGRSCDDREPTAQQLADAHAEADEHIRRCVEAGE